MIERERREEMFNNNIIGENYTREQIYNDVYRYIAETGYHFESYGSNYGQIIYGGDELTNHYIIKKDESNEKMDNDSFINNNNSNIYG